MSGTVAHAEKRLFILANQADGYGVDNCLASGAECGKTVANSYCRSHAFAQAVSFRKVSRDDITGAIPADASARAKAAAATTSSPLSARADTSRPPPTPQQRLQLSAERVVD